eukprot:973556-Alexandrium_andersonii.AAC.1
MVYLGASRGIGPLPGSALTSTGPPAARPAPGPAGRGARRDATWRTFASRSLFHLEHFGADKFQPRRRPRLQEGR